MDKTQRAIVSTTCKASMAQSIAEGEASQFDVLSKYAEKGVEIRYWSDEMLGHFEKSWDQVATKMMTDDKFFNKVYSDLTTFRAKYDLWEKNAFLPRKTR